MLVIILTIEVNKKWIPTHVDVPMSSGLLKPSIALCEQVQLLTREDFVNKVGYCDDYIMSKISNALKVQFDLIENRNKIIS